VWEDPAPLHVEVVVPYPEPVGPKDDVPKSARAKQPNTCGCGEMAAAAAVGPLLRFAGYDPDTGGRDDSFSGGVVVGGQGPEAAVGGGRATPRR
jgi:hypothetical protein